MGVAMYIVTEKEIRGVDSFVNGKAIGHADQTAIDNICAQVGIKSPYDYVSQDPADLREMLEDLDDDIPQDLPDEQWFAPEDGVHWVETLSTFLRDKPDSLKGSAEVLEDLDEYLHLLKKLCDSNVRWHFAVDF